MEQDRIASLEGQPASHAKGEPIPLSLVNDYLYCARRAAFKLIEGCREANDHTERGDIVHEHSDLAGYEVVQGVKLLRALPVFSDRLGLNGKCDIVEQHADGSLVPVEFKLGRRRRWENDDAQLCGQALCLEEMFSVNISCGAVFHADSKRRREVVFTPALRQLTVQAITALREFLAGSADSRLPAAFFKPACDECSLYRICLPQLSAAPEAAVRAAKALFTG